MSRMRQMSACPFQAARCRGKQPRLSSRLAEASCCRSSRTAYLVRAAQGVRPQHHNTGGGQTTTQWHVGSDHNTATQAVRPQHSNTGVRAKHRGLRPQHRGQTTTQQHRGQSTTQGIETTTQGSDHNTAAQGVRPQHWG